MSVGPNAGGSTDARTQKILTRAETEDTLLQRNYSRAFRLPLPEAETL